MKLNTIVRFGIFAIVFATFSVKAVHCDHSSERDQNIQKEKSNCSALTRLANNGSCTCGNFDLHGVTCQNNEILSPLCYCLSYNMQFNVTVVGYCVMKCTINHDDGFINRQRDWYKVITHTNNLSEVNRDLCSGLHMNRTGQLCGSCLKGYAPPVYSYSMDCVNCTSNYKYNWLKYIAIAYLPLTAFYIFVIVFRLSITSGKMNGYVLTTQLLVAPAVLRFLSRTLLTTTNNTHVTVWTAKLVTSFYAILNLDYFRPFYPLFCIHPDMTTIQTIALEYGIAVYPLLLIIITYIAVSLHYRYSTVVRLWRPFYKCFILLRKEWDIRASLVEAFATFILLSYVKILNTSLDLLTPVFLLRTDGDYIKQPYLRVSGNVEYFGRDHLPYALLALFMVITFNILPMVLLFLYPCQCFHRCLNYFNIHRRILNEFMEVFYGSFKQTPTQDFRYFAAVYLLIRFINLVLLSVMNGYWYFVVSGILLFISALVIGLARPHTISRHSVIDALLLACIGLCCNSVSYTSDSMEANMFTATRYYQGIFNFVRTILFSVHFFYGVGLILFTILPRGKLKSVILSFYDKVCLKMKHQNCEDEEALPLFHDPREYTPLI